MFSMLMITFREGLEAFLVASIALAWLRGTGRQPLVAAARWGIAVAVIGCAILGVVLAQAGGMSPLWEGGLALVAAVLVISCTVHMLRHGKRMAAQMRSGLAAASRGDGRGARLAVFGFMLLMIGREGVEAATMIASLARQADLQHMAVGGLAGLALAASIAVLWSRYGHRVDLGLFFRVTAAFMAVFSLQLLVYAFHELTEGGALPLLDNAWWHIATEPYGPEGEYGAWLSYSLVLVPLGLLAHGLLLHSARGQSSSASARAVQGAVEYLPVSTDR